MVERVAQALIKYATEQPKTSDINLSPEALVGKIYAGMARVAIEAMREPTPDMTAAGMIKAKQPGSRWIGLIDAADGFNAAYQAAIDAALGE